MRKADYAALATVLRAKIEDARAAIAGAKTIEGHSGAVVAHCTAKQIAKECAAVLSVNRAEFLKACGIEP